MEPQYGVVLLKDDGSLVWVRDIMDRSNLLKTSLLNVAESQCNVYKRSWPNNFYMVMEFK